MAQRRRQAFADSFYRFDFTPGNRDDAEYNLRGRQLLQQRQIVVPMGVFERHGIDTGLLDRIGDLQVRIGIGLGIIFTILSG